MQSMLVYNSQSNVPSAAGIGWVTPFDRQLVQSGSSVLLVSGSGTVAIFQSLGGGTYQSVGGFGNSLKLNSDGTYSVTQPNQFRSDYSSGGQLFRLVSAANQISTFLRDSTTQRIKAILADAAADVL